MFFKLFNTESYYLSRIFVVTSPKKIGESTFVPGGDGKLMPMKDFMKFYKKWGKKV